MFNIMMSGFSILLFSFCTSIFVLNQKPFWIAISFVGFVISTVVYWMSALKHEEEKKRGLKK